MLHNFNTELTGAFSDVKFKQGAFKFVKKIIYSESEKNI
jgi:hypothetical protein